MGSGNEKGGNKMKTTSFAVFLGLVFISPGFAGIRGTEWGMAIEQVKKIEKGTFEEGLHDGLPYLSYEKEILKVESTITYEFDERRRLYRIVYAFIPEGPDTVSIHRKVEEILTSKYGKPKIEFVGIATCRIVWEVGDTKIELSYRFSSPSFYVVYSNPAMEEEVSRSKVLFLTEKSDEGELERRKEIKELAKDF